MSDSYSGVVGPVKKGFNMGDALKSKGSAPLKTIYTNAVGKHVKK